MCLCLCFFYRISHLHPFPPLPGCGESFSCPSNKVEHRLFYRPALRTEDFLSSFVALFCFSIAQLGTADQAASRRTLLLIGQSRGNRLILLLGDGVPRPRRDRTRSSRSHGDQNQTRPSRRRTGGSWAKAQSSREAAKGRTCLLSSRSSLPRN